MTVVTGTTRNGVNTGTMFATLGSDQGAAGAGALSVPGEQPLDRWRPQPIDDQGFYDFATPRELVGAFEAAPNTKDADAIGRIFTADAEFVNIMGVRMRGREGIVSGHAWAFPVPSAVAPSTSMRSTNCP